MSSLQSSERQSFPGDSSAEALAIDRKWATEPDRGDRSVSPFEITWRGWRAIFRRTYQALDEDRILAVAGGVVFFVLLAIFPAITAFVSLYGLFTPPASV